MEINEEVLNAFRNQLTHYFKKGIGAKSELSKNTTITPKLVINTFNRYLELGGTLDFIYDKSEFNLDEYNEFIDEIQEC